jgi:CBS domain-containing protein
MQTVGQLLQNKGHEVTTVSPDAMVYRALQMMSENGVGALPVLDDAGRVIGIVSERDYARKVILEGRSSKETAIKDIMTPELFVVGIKNTLNECMGIMSEKRVRHLPVIDNGKLVGIISIGDVLKAIISEQGILIEHLHNYIMGTYV